ncbi:60S acidic ribosomal protein P1 [Capsicum annuum]|uniref:60S acidic ribosomal protein P1 n=1 Tax=Capsicum annuum TaxID=4072 RepID=A0A2G3A027_CAPAN|nr:60S acidic ribosomal protein P1 [Capsicum annuum]
MSVGELGCTYAALLLFDDGIPITSEKIATVVKAANISVESYWPSLFAKLFEKRDIEDLILNVGTGGGAAAAPATAEKKEETKEESDDDLGLNLFD